MFSLSLNKNIQKIAAAALTATVLSSIPNVAAQAAPIAGLPSGGVALSMTNNANSLDVIATGTEMPKSKSMPIVQADPDEPEVLEMLVSPKANSEEADFSNLVIAKVTNYVNVRSFPNEESAILGKLYDRSVGRFICEDNGWYLIESGSVIGYVKGEYCVTGEEAAELAKKVCTRIATVNTTTLKVRTAPSLEATVLGLVPMGDALLVSDEVDGWVRVDVEEGIGWVSTEFVDLTIEFVQAESKAEEEARLAKEAEERRKAREAAAKATSSKTKTTTVVPVVSGSGSEMGNSVAEYALQFVGNPYVYGGTSLTKGADCSGFVMSVYENFGVSLPHSSAADRKQGYAVEGGLDNAQPGDLICYSGHVALYIGDGQIVHASTSKTGIIVSKADYKKILAIRRIF